MSSSCSTLKTRLSQTTWLAMVTPESDGSSPSRWRRTLVKCHEISIDILYFKNDHNTTCFVDNVKCDISDGTLVEMHIETTWQECSVLCQDEVRCVAFNFFGPGSNFYPRSSCLLFSACEKRLPAATVSSEQTKTTVPAVLTSTEIFTKVTL